METIKVNMSPNPLDVQTIHASQNDGEAREWGFALHNNGDAIDSSSISDQLVFKSYEGGTEQILPENGAVPVTAPFVGDINYPDTTRNDQEFLYRQSPTEEDGNAKITDIKGNTLVWNQQNYDNFTDTSKWLVNDGSKYSVSVSGNVLTITCTGAPDNNASVRISGVNSIVGHKYLLLSDVKSPKTVDFRYIYSPAASGSLSMSVPANVWTQFGKVVQINSSSGFYTYFNSNMALAQGDVVKIKNHQIIDLTQMFGSTKADEIYAMEQAQAGSGVAYFKSLFPLPYYQHDAGSLLSFNGNGIKTVGFNQWDEEWELGGVDIRNGVPIQNSSQIRSKNFCPLIGGKTYYMTCGKTDGGSQNRYYLAVCFYDNEQTFISSAYANNLTFVAPSNASCFKLTTNSSTVVYGNTYNNDICVNISSSRNGQYEPYTSSTLSLPISTYFPTGMKSAGDVYDELTPSKAITRIGMVDLGSLTWDRKTINEGYAFVSEVLYSLKPAGNDSTANVLCPSYTLYMSGTGYSMPNDKTYRIGGTYFGIKRVIIRDDAYTDATAFKSAMSGVYLYYKLDTPTETSFTTASLVTENAEIPLSNEDGVLIGKCTEQLSENPGFIDAKIKLSDGDGECYSNKIQLHVERSPQ